MIYISNLAYSLHLGSDKNKRNSARSSAKNNASGSTSLSNNSIQNAQGLSRVDKHNYRKYDNKQDNIEIIRGSSSLYDDVKNLYKEEFEEARLEYNAKQTRDNRKINDYFSHVSNNSKSDLACEIIIELGDKKYWDTKDLNFKKRMTSVYMEQVKDLETLVPNFKVASAIIHYDETSPHLHIVGVPIKVGGKNGMSKQVGKSDVFTKESLRKLQDKMRTLCIESFNKEYNLNSKLKPKMKGRNKDYNVSEMDNYQAMKDELQKNKEKLELANKQSLELDNKSKDKEIEELKKENHSLRNTLEFWKDKFLRVISLIKNKLLGIEKEREKYMDFAEDMYYKRIIKEDTFEDLKENNNYSKNHDSIEKDDFDLEI